MLIEKKEFWQSIYSYLVFAAVLVWFVMPWRLIHSQPQDANATDSFSDDSTTTTETPKKRALIIGIEQYCPKDAACNKNTPYWWDLNTDAEVEALAEVLRDPHGQYRFDEVKVIKNGDATHAAIVAAFKEFLIAQTKQGDIAYFHFSGHGYQVPDDAKHGRNPIIGDEIDGLDETLVPFDYKKGKDGSNDIRDDEIGDLLEKLQGKSPANITLTFDSCFSGTIQRGGNSVVRGSRWSWPVPTTAFTKASVHDGPSGLLASGAAKKNGYVLMSATRNDQLAKQKHDYQTDLDYGAFTFALVKALRQAGEDTTYRDTFQKISDDVSRDQLDQNPQIEGQQDQKLMSGAVRTPSPYTAVTLSPDTKEVLLKAGVFMGVSTGSEYSIYEAGKDVTGQPIAKAVVVSTRNLNATLKVTPTPTEPILEKLKTGRAIETRHSFGDLRLKVSGQEVLSSNAQNQLKALGLVAPAANGKEADILICNGRCANEAPSKIADPKGNFVTIQRSAGGDVISRASPDDGSEIATLLAGEARWRFFNSLKDGGDRTISDKVKIRLVPVRVTGTDPDPMKGWATKTVDTAPLVSSTEGGRIELREGDTVMLEVANTSSQPLFVTVIEVKGNGNVTPLFPHPAIPIGNSAENKFPPAKKDVKGNWIYRRIPCPFVVEMKYIGTEAFRIIASFQESDFSPLFMPNGIDATKGGNSRGIAEARSAFGQLLLSGMTEPIAGAKRTTFGKADLKAVSLDDPGVAISSILFEVKPK